MGTSMLSMVEYDLKEELLSLWSEMDDKEMRPESTTETGAEYPLLSFILLLSFVLLVGNEKNPCHPGSEEESLPPWFRGRKLEARR